jgi:transcriptional regulator with XRE-family HTH domain
MPESLEERGCRIRVARKSQGLTQRQLGCLAGMHPVHVCQVEKGDVMISGKPAFNRLEEVLGVYPVFDSPIPGWRW